MTIAIIVFPRTRHARAETMGSGLQEIYIAPTKLADRSSLGRGLMGNGLGLRMEELLGNSS